MILPGRLLVLGFLEAAFLSFYMPIVAKHNAKHRSPFNLL
jgi:hypothetical protein